VCISKSIGGGLPLSLLLIKPSVDVWAPAEHTGTFRGNQLAFVAANALLDYWGEQDFLNTLASNSAKSYAGLVEIAKHCPDASVRGRGMILGLDVADGDLAQDVSRRCFENGLIMETAGASNQVLKFLAPLTIEAEVLSKGLACLETSMFQALECRTGKPALRSVKR